MIEIGSFWCSKTVWRFFKENEKDMERYTLKFEKNMSHLMALLIIITSRLDFDTFIDTYNAMLAGGFCLRYLLRTLNSF